jgi:molybdate transport system substrate-binding protein
MSTERPALKGIASMATRSLLVQLTEQYERETGQRVAIESVGGVDAAKRVTGGEPFDLVLLAADVMERMAAEGKIDRGSLIGVVNSGIAVAVKAGAPAPDIRDEGSIRQAVKNARAIGYSTGPSGGYIVRLLEKWGEPTEDASGKQRLVQARPGIPVGSLIAAGEVDIGFQQLSELLNVEGINLLGPLPDSIQLTTTFSAAMGSAVRDRQAAQAFLAFLASPAADAAKAANGMTAA